MKDSKKERKKGRKEDYNEERKAGKETLPFRTIVETTKQQANR